jgi:hypothetical protein
MKLMSCLGNTYTILTSTSYDKNEKEQTMKEKATFGGGCFWCIEAIYKLVNGVSAVTSGYAGGGTKNPTYTSKSVVDIPAMQK